MVYLCLFTTMSLEGQAMRQLSDRVTELVEEAYKVVDGHCGCGEETCCYGCIANYYNQSKQAKLSRGAAKRILGSLLGY